MQNLELNEIDIEKSAGLIIEKEGVNELTLDSLGLNMGIPTSEFTKYFKDDDEILKFMAFKLEFELQQLIYNSENKKIEPEQKLADLFKILYEFFSRKSYFLELMFYDVVDNNDSAIQMILLRIRKNIENHLTQIIEQGKKTGVFNNDNNTSHEVESILHRFRLLMSDIPLTNKMVRDLKTIKEEGD